jgi:glycosyltransferase involved in cell wall biosynthesis
LPSYREGLPKSLIEAAACGRAVITTDVPGCRDAITPNVTGLLVPVKEVDGLVSAIEKLVNNSALRNQMADAGRKLAEQAYDIQKVIAVHLNIYQGPPPRMLFMVNIAKFFLSHWLPEALEAKKRGYEVHVATMHGPEIEQINQAGLTHHVLPLSRSGKNIILELRSFISILRLFRRLKPQLMHLMTIKPVIYGGLAARLTRVPGVLAVVTGLGYVFIHQGVRAFIVRTIVSKLYKSVFAHPNLLAVFENESDKQNFLDDNLVSDEKSKVINGAGVDLSLYKALPEPVEPVVFVFAARLLVDKGFSEYIAAATEVKKRFPKTRFLVAGDIDEGNPASVTAEQIKQLDSQGIVEFLGFRDDIPDIFAQCHVVVLPSYREGLPKVLIEAAACARAVITTDVPGCRHAVVENETALLAPVRNIDALVDAMVLLIEQPETRRQFGLAGRQLAEARYSIEQTVAAYFELYNQLVEHKS